MTAPAAPATEIQPASPRIRTRHRDEYWDVFTASWRRATPTVPRPRSGN
jgi:hypothetical protein